MTVDVAATADPQCNGSAAEEDRVVNDISDAVQQCLATLKGLWSDVGADPEERLRVCREIALDVDRALQAKISDARETKAQTALKIRLALRRMKAIYVQIGTAPPDTDFTCVDDSSGTDSVNSLPCGENQMGLILQLAKLEGMLAAADVQREERSEVFTRKTDKLRELLVEQYGVLNAEREGCLDLSGETDLSDARERLLAEAIAAGIAARAARANDIKECVTTLRALWAVLGSDDDQQGTEQGTWAALDAQVYAGGADLKPSTAVLCSAKERLASLQALEGVRREAVSALLSSLQLLWMRVQTPPEEQAAYLQEHTGITVQHIQHHETTIAALEKTLHDLLPGLIGAGTERLSHLQLALLEEETPVHTFSSTPAVSVLEEVEAAVTVAEARLQRRHSVLGLIERRDAILKEAAELKNAGQVLSLSHTHPRAHSHAPTRTHSLILSRIHSHSHAPTHSLILSSILSHTRRIRRGCSTSLQGRSVRVSRRKSAGIWCASNLHTKRNLQKKTNSFQSRPKETFLHAYIHARNIGNS